jgi:hypothetical protein
MPLAAARGNEGKRRMTMAVNEKLLEDRLGALETARPWSPRVVSRLEALIRSGEDEALFRVNPIRFAADKGIAEAEAIDLFLHAVAQGLFEMNWMLLCSLCGCVTESFGTMNRLHDHHHCNLCRTDLDAKLDDYIAVSFTVSPRSARSNSIGRKNSRRRTIASSTTSRPKARARMDACSVRSSRMRPWH